MGIPQGVIAATLLTFSTSLPKLVTAITAVRKGHGELAIGNIVGAELKANKKATMIQASWSEDIIMSETKRSFSKGNLKICEINPTLKAGILMKLCFIYLPTRKIFNCDC